MNADTITMLTQLVAQTQANLTSYTELLTLAQNGWQQDQATLAAAAAVTAASAAIATANTTISAIPPMPVPSSAQ